MRKIECKDIHAVNVEEFLEEFNERRGEFRIKDQDIISFSVRDAKEPMNIVSHRGQMKSTIVVSVFFWRDDD